jgi:hypothetical protein
MLPYTFDKLMTETAVVERDEAVLDEFGGEAKAERVVIGSISCRYWWWKTGGSRGGSREFATPQRTINFTGGGLVCPLGSDIQDQDRIKEILDSEGNVMVDGPLRVVGVEEWDDHIEANLMRP